MIFIIKYLATNTINMVIKTSFKVVAAIGFIIVSFYFVALLIAASTISVGGSMPFQSSSLPTHLLSSIKAVNNSGAAAISFALAFHSSSGPVTWMVAIY